MLHTQSLCACPAHTVSEFSCGALFMTGVGDGVATRQQAPSCVATINVASYNERCHRAHLSCRERVTLKILCLPHALLRRFDGAVAYSMVRLSWCDSAESATKQTRSQRTWLSAYSKSCSSVICVTKTNCRTPNTSRAQPMKPRAPHHPSV